MDSNYKERVQYFENTLSSQDAFDDLEHDWKPVIDMKQFRDAAFHGIPDDPGLRSTAWKVLLGYLPPDKRMWDSVLSSQRLCYYNWVKDLLEEPGDAPPASDHPLNANPGSQWASYFHDNTTLEQIDKDIRRTLPDIAFFQMHVPRNPLNPLSPPKQDDDHYNRQDTDPLGTGAGGAGGGDDDTKRPRRFSFGFMGRPRSSSAASKKSIKTSNLSPLVCFRRRHGIFSRNIVRKFSSAFKSNSPLASVVSNKRKVFDIRDCKPLCTPVPNRRTLFRRIAHIAATSDGTPPPPHDDSEPDYHWEAVERILFIYAKLNPGVGYVQGMNELLAPLYYVFAKDPHPEHQAYAEADAFFVFTILMSDVRDHFVRSLDQDASSGINATLHRMSRRLSWIDKPLWRDLRRKDIKEHYYAFRWITVICCQEWDLPDVIRLWDSILADRDTQAEASDMRFEFLLDFTVAMILCVRQEILKGDFAENVRLLQNYPIDDIQVVLNTAYAVRDMRLQALEAGQVVPGVNDQRNSGLFASDWSDTSSMNSTASGRLQKLRDTTDMARASFDSFRKESRESLDELFRRGIRSGEETWKRNSTGEVARSLSQKLGAVNGMVSARLQRRPSNSSIEADTPVAAASHLGRSGSVSSERMTTATTPTRSNSLLNRFSQMMSNNSTSVSPANRFKAMARTNSTGGHHVPPGEEKRQYFVSTAARDDALNPRQGFYRGYV
ncbi:rab-GTPase-TBC domain-containing protein [Syncephalastrum racemosum]|uniref:Rab-GTPase-TBC domain-containing protein n=1 Tax=Syncephalastrum racemosum TaxID=13706 RepID=A0A1X2H5V1_SYNRA|nr:rab-GTPase-TBC domain-containing protein [Syncephalastrum racemosum]